MRRSDGDDGHDGDAGDGCDTMNRYCYWTQTGGFRSASDHRFDRPVGTVRRPAGTARYPIMLPASAGRFAGGSATGRFAANQLSAPIRSSFENGPAENSAAADCHCSVETERFSKKRQSSESGPAESFCASRCCYYFVETGFHRRRMLIFATWRSLLAVRHLRRRAVPILRKPRAAKARPTRGS